MKAGTLHKFIVEANKASGTTYQWQVSENGGKTWRNFYEKKTAVTNQLFFTLTKDMNNWKLRCIVRNGNEKVSSTAVTVKVNLTT